MRLSERQKALARLQWSKTQILPKHAALFDASNHAFCYALQVVLNHVYVSLCWPHTCCARRPLSWEASSSTEFAQQMSALFAEDTTERFELTIEQWKSRPWYNKVSERILAPL